MNFFERRNILKKLNYFDAIPVRQKEFTINEEGRVTLLVPKFSNRFLERYLIPKHKSKMIKVLLDPAGSDVWKEIDGKSNVGDICIRLRKDDKLEKKSDADVFDARVMKFITELYNRKYLTFKQLLNP